MVTSVDCMKSLARCWWKKRERKYSWFACNQVTSYTLICTQYSETSVQQRAKGLAKMFAITRFLLPRFSVSMLYFYSCEEYLSLFVIEVRYIEVLFHLFYYFWCEGYLSLFVKRFFISRFPWSTLHVCSLLGDCQRKLWTSSLAVYWGENKFLLSEKIWIIFKTC